MKRSTYDSPALLSSAIIAAGFAMAAAIFSRRASRSHYLEGKRALITGGSRGLGLAIAKELAEDGCQVAICARSEEELTKARELLAEKNHRVETFVCDLTVPEQIDRLMAGVVERLGSIDILINNAGIIQVGPIESVTLDDFDHAMKVIFWGTLRPTLAVLPHMIARRSGHIVNITSIGGAVSIPRLLPYCAAKFAAVGFSEGLGAEVAQKGVHVLTVLPGLMRTGSFLKAQYKGDARREFSWFTLLGNLPGASISADRAAREIVSALRRGKTRATISIQAQALELIKHLMPELTHDLLSLVNRTLLPRISSNPELRGGHEVDQRYRNMLFDLVTILGRRAADSWNQRAVPQT